ncbi:MAG: ABC transporter ATP-binding protein [Candidatus Pacearchaeota archaeon]
MKMVSMEFQKYNITDKIYLLVFEKQKDLGETFVRFQEHYESPEFAGRIFSLEEYKDWYIKNMPNAREKSRFTYYEDWNGFNIPSYVMRSFYEGRFNPLSEKEQKILDLFRNEEEPFYIIGTNKEVEDLEGYLRHETAHGLFYTDKKYRDKVLKIISEFDTSKMENELVEQGYHTEVLKDEVHAYSIDYEDSLKNCLTKEAREILREVYKEYLKKNNASFPEIK